MNILPTGIFDSPRPKKRAHNDPDMLTCTNSFAYKISLSNLTSPLGLPTIHLPGYYISSMPHNMSKYTPGCEKQRRG